MYYQKDKTKPESNRLQRRPDHPIIAENVFFEYNVTETVTIQ